MTAECFARDCSVITPREQHQPCPAACNPVFRVAVSNLQCITCCSPVLKASKVAANTVPNARNGAWEELSNPPSMGRRGRADGQTGHVWAGHPIRGVVLEPGRGSHGCPNMGAHLSWAEVTGYMGKVHAHKIEFATASPALEGTRTVHVTEFGSQRCVECCAVRGGHGPLDHQRCATKTQRAETLSQACGQLWFGPFLI